MSEPSHRPHPEAAEREPEYQDAHYHDEDPEIQNDDVLRLNRALPVRKRGRRPLLPKRRFYEE